MIINCKYCGKEIKATGGKRQYCDKKCRDNYRNDQRSGKIKESKDNPTDKPEKSVRCSVVSINTTARGCVRFTVEAVISELGFDALKYFGNAADLMLYGEIEEEKEEPDPYMG